MCVCKFGCVALLSHVLFPVIYSSSSSNLDDFFASVPKVTNTSVRSSLVPPIVGEIQVASKPVVAESVAAVPVVSRPKSATAPVVLKPVSQVVSMPMTAILVESQPVKAISAAPKIRPEESSSVKPSPVKPSSVELSSAVPRSVEPEIVVKDKSGIILKGSSTLGPLSSSGRTSSSRPLQDVTSQSQNLVSSHIMIRCSVRPNSSPDFISGSLFPYAFPS